jgi:hypothetical protein
MVYGLGPENTEIAASNFSSSAAEICFARRCPRMAVSSFSTLPSFSHHITVLSVKLYFLQSHLLEH